MDRRLKEQFDLAVGHFWSYVERCGEQVFTGKCVMTLNFKFGGLGHPNFEEHEVKTFDEMKRDEVKKFSEIIQAK